MSDPYACASLHVEHVEKEYAVGAGTEVEVQDPEGQHLEEEYEGADQEPEPEPELTNFYNTQGKPRFILKPSVTTLSLSLTIAAIFMH